MKKQLIIATVSLSILAAWSLSDAVQAKHPQLPKVAEDDELFQVRVRHILETNEWHDPKVGFVNYNGEYIAGGQILYATKPICDHNKVSVKTYEVSRKTYYYVGDDIIMAKSKPLRRFKVETTYTITTNTSPEIEVSIENKE